MDVEIEECKFRSNVSLAGACLVSYGKSHLNIESCQLETNRAIDMKDGNGGAFAFFVMKIIYIIY